MPHIENPPGHAAWRQAAERLAAEIARTAEVKANTVTLREMREHNHFADTFAQALGSKPYDDPAQS